MKPVLRFLVFVAVVLCVTPLLACPNCKDSLAANDPTASGLAKGYFYSILFMLGMPVTILSLLSAYFYMLVRRARRAVALAPAVASETAAGVTGVNPFGPAATTPRTSLPLWSPSLADQPASTLP